MGGQASSPAARLAERSTSACRRRNERVLEDPRRPGGPPHSSAQCAYHERMRPVRYISVLLLALSAILPSARLARAAKASREYLVYFGTYTGKGSKGIYRSEEHTSELQSLRHL